MGLCGHVPLQLLLYWIPFIYVSFLLTSGAGFVLALAINYAVKAGHCRNPAVAMLMATLITLAALGAKYYFQYDAMLNETVTAVKEDPDVPEAKDLTDSEIKQAIKSDFGFIEHLKLRIENGWEIGGRGGGGGMPLTGPFVILIWIIEAGLLLYFAVSGARETSGMPYNEQLGQWANEEEVLCTVPVDEATINSIAGLSTIEELMTLPPTTKQTNEFLTYTTHSIPGEEMEDAFLSVKHLNIKINNKGETETNDTALHSFAVITPDQRMTFVTAAEALTAKLDAEAEAEEAAEPAESENNEAETA